MIHIDLRKIGTNCQRILVSHEVAPNFNHLSSIELFSVIIQERLIGTFHYMLFIYNACYNFSPN